MAWYNGVGENLPYYGIGKSLPYNGTVWYGTVKMSRKNGTPTVQKSRVYRGFQA